MQRLAGLGFRPFPLLGRRGCSVVQRRLDPHSSGRTLRRRKPKLKAQKYRDATKTALPCST